MSLVLLKIVSVFFIWLSTLKISEIIFENPYTKSIMFY